ncbi:MAG TPA: alanyl-tRNA editing protein [Anaerolineales bacterium]|nr:alanyl-tRNA editing protein [Anaerolineales bacterium]
MALQPTNRLYLQDESRFETEAVIAAIRADDLAFDRSCFYPGGGGQPPDEGAIRLPSGELIDILSASMDEEEVVWHRCKTTPPAGLAGRTVSLSLNRGRRLALMRAHTALHVLNTLALQEYGAWITGVQIGTEHSRIDFKIEDFTPAVCRGLEAKVNAVLAEGHAVRSFYISEKEFQRREDLLRTLGVRPPVAHGQVRVVEIQGFDAQACGGTHVHDTREVGKVVIFRTENKGRINKRLYVRLEPAA